MDNQCTLVDVKCTQVGLVVYFDIDPVFVASRKRIGQGCKMIYILKNLRTKKS